MSQAPKLQIRQLTAGDQAAWLPLWKDYCLFYGEDLPAATTQTTWSRLVAAESPLQGWGAFDTQERLLGFAHTVLHPHTWSPRTLCYLEDLYVTPESRGRGVGHALIEHLHVLAEQQGWGRVYWHTETTNVVARRLYDRFRPADAYVRYTLTF